MADKAPKKKEFKKYELGKMCPKCGSRMADHSNRYACGKCGYAEFKKKE